MTTVLEDETWLVAAAAVPASQFFTDLNSWTMDSSTDMTWINPDSSNWSGDTYKNGNVASFLSDGAGLHPG